MQVCLNADRKRCKSSSSVKVQRAADQAIQH